MLNVEDSRIRSTHAKISFVSVKFTQERSVIINLIINLKIINRPWYVDYKHHFYDLQDGLITVLDLTTYDEEDALLQTLNTESSVVISSLSLYFIYHLTSIYFQPLIFLITERKISPGRQYSRCMNFPFRENSA